MIKTKIKDKNTVDKNETKKKLLNILHELYLIHCTV